jgi:hypothetical protein
LEGSDVIDQAMLAALDELEDLDIVDETILAVQD